jgi:uncharacterized repeat protein (TIGR03803 family)
MRRATSTALQLQPYSSYHQIAAGAGLQTFSTHLRALKTGAFQRATPILDKAGNLYGTTVDGGAGNYGTVYKLTPKVDGKWTEEIVYSFEGGSKGSEPWAGVVFDRAGNIYGTTLLGVHAGYVYELVASTTGKFKEKILGALSGVGGSNGLFSYGSLILDSAGNLYGTTEGGGSSGAGTVFKVIR